MITAIVGTAAEWQAENQRILMAALDRVRQQLQRDPLTRSSAEAHSMGEARSETIATTPDVSALSQLCRMFGLSAFDRNLLLLCAGMELDATFAALCAQAQPEAKQGAPTFNLAAVLFEQSYWEAFAPHAPLRRWQLIEVGAGSTLMSSPLRMMSEFALFDGNRSARRSPLWTDQSR